MPSRKTSKPSPDGRKPLGDFGERVAAAHLQAKGYGIIDSKFRVFEAEIDLVARDGGDIVFVEVRTRRGGEPGMAALSISRTKARKMRHAVEWYVERHPDIADAPLRIDVVTVELDGDGTLREVTHIEDAVRG
jgi:putative endonuclease